MNTYTVTLRKGLDPNAEILATIGTADSISSALSLALSYVNNPKNFNMLQARSYYVRKIVFKEDECIGIDYGSWTRFVIVCKD